MMPIQARLYLAMTDQSPCSGYLRFIIGGFSFQFPLMISRNQMGHRLLLYMGKYKIPILIKKRKKPLLQQVFPIWKNQIERWKRTVFLSVFLQLGLENAAATALVCAGLRSALNLGKQLRFHIVPQYHTAGYVLQIRCIALFRLGKLWLTAVLLGMALLRRKLVGGAAHGNRKGQTDQRGHADGA